MMLQPGTFVLGGALAGSTAQHALLQHGCETPASRVRRQTRLVHVGDIAMRANATATDMTLLSFKCAGHGYSCTRKAVEWTGHLTAKSTP
jgi:hypothetical protein